MRLGVSGHQKIEPQECLPWLEQEIRAELIRVNATAGVSSLAAGTDQIFAATAIDLGLKLEVVIPSQRYELSFGDEAGRACFIELLAVASDRHQLAFPEPSEEAYWAAGKRVVDISEAMLFVWNGKPAQGLGGTADVVRYAKDRGVPYIWLDPTRRRVERFDL